MYLVCNDDFTPRCHVNAVQDDIFATTVLIWLHDTVVLLVQYERDDALHGGGNILQGNQHHQKTIVRL